MAPEQTRGQACTASDQYALGVMVYEWLCGEPPFSGPHLAVFYQHLSTPPPSLCTRLPHLPQAVEDTVLGALAKDPQHRFSTVQEFATALKEAFYSTQLLVLDGTVEANISHEITHTLAAATPLATPTPSEQTNDITQPRLKATIPVQEYVPPLPNPSTISLLWSRSGS